MMRKNTFWEICILTPLIFVFVHQRLAGLDPLIFAGDFNIKPLDPCYHLITKGALPEGSTALPHSPEWETKAAPDWRVELDRLVSFGWVVNALVLMIVYTTLLRGGGV